MPLNDTFLCNLKPLDRVKKYSDGQGLYLHLDPLGGKYWRMAYRFDGKQKTLSFGSYPIVTLKDARQSRYQAKALLSKWLDPGEPKRCPLPGKKSRRTLLPQWLKNGLPKTPPA